MAAFDLAILGGGTAAVAAATQADELGAKTVMVYGGSPLGGTCVNSGCVPSKALLRAGEVMHLARHHGIPGLEIDVKQFDFARVVQDELDLVAQLRYQKYETVVPDLANVTVVEGMSRFVNDHEVGVNGETLRAEKIIIATGSTATVPPIPGLLDVDLLTHIEALQLKRLPSELIIIGGGPVGLEFAQMYARFGTEVTLLQRAGSILPAAEGELTERLTATLTGEGITIETGIEVTQVRQSGETKTVAYRAGDRQMEIEADALLLAAGKTPNTGSLDLPAAGVETDDRHAVKVNAQFQTSQPHVYAIGDVNDLPLRENPTAGREGTLATRNALDGTSQTIDYDHIPTTVFTDPQLASVGITEAEQLRRTGASDCRTISFENVPKAVITRRTEGLVNIVTEPQTQQILGIHILGPDAGDLIAQAMTLVANHATVDDVINSAPMYPTLSEAIKIAALSFTKDITKMCCSY